jgi:hypothetical protein
MESMVEDDMDTGTMLMAMVDMITEDDTDMMTMDIIRTS